MKDLTGLSKDELTVYRKSLYARPFTLTKQKEIDRINEFEKVRDKEQKKKLT